MRKSFSLHSLFLILVLLQNPVWSDTQAPAQTPNPTGIRPLSYEEAVKVALSDNVDLLALLSQQDSLRHQATQAIAPNEPTLQYTNADMPTMLRSSAAENSIGVAWTLGFPGKALSNSSALRRQADAVKEQALNQEITILTALSNNYVAFSIDDAFYKFLLNEQQKYNDLIKLIEKKFITAQAAKVDLLNARVASEQINLAIVQNRNDYDIQLTTFRQLIHRPENQTLFPEVPEKIIIPPITQTFEELRPIMLKNNHAIAAAARTVDSQSDLVTSATLQAFPDLQLSAAKNKWNQFGAAPNPGVTDDYTAGIAIVVPIFYLFNEFSGLEAAKANLESSQYQHTSQQLQAIAALQMAYTSLKATLKDLETSERLVIPAAKQSFDLTLITYGLGKADYFMLNQARQAWHDAVRDNLTKRQNAAQFYNQIISQLGCDIGKKEGPHACK